MNGTFAFPSMSSVKSEQHFQAPHLHTAGMHQPGEFTKNVLMASVPQYGIQGGYGGANLSS